MLEIPSTLKVAQEQLDAAIELYFTDRSSIAVHTLTCAAYEILDKLCVKQGIQRSIIEESLNKFIPSEKRKSVHDGIFAMKNYFKHGNLTQGVKPTWDAELTLYFLIDATTLYRNLNNHIMTKNIAIYSLWFRMTNPDMFLRSEAMDKLIDSLSIQLKGGTKMQFYKLSLTAFDQNPELLESVKPLG